MLAALDRRHERLRRHQRRRRRRRQPPKSQTRRRQPQRHATSSAVLGVMEMCWGDVGLLLSMPRQGLGNAAIAAVANEEQLLRYEGSWAAMAITEPESGSDSASIRTTATLDGDEYVLNGEKIYVTAGERAELVVVWASLDREIGPGRDQVVRRRALEPGHGPRPPRAQARHPRLGHRRVPPRELPRAEGGPPRQPGHRHEALVRGRHEDVRQHPPARRRDGRGRGEGVDRLHARAAGRGRHRARLRPAGRTSSPPPRRR